MTREFYLRYLHDAATTLSRYVEHTEPYAYLDSLGSMLEIWRKQIQAVEAEVAAVASSPDEGDYFKRFEVFVPEVLAMAGIQR